ncbi:MAG: hypothetical protein ACK52S_16180 [Pirellula sp.]|jgi:hypothetical protein
MRAIPFRGDGTAYVYPIRITDNTTGDPQREIQALLPKQILSKR